LLRHLERKIPCHRPRNKNCIRSYESDETRTKTSKKETIESSIETKTSKKETIESSIETKTSKKETIESSIGTKVSKKDSYKDSFKCRCCHLVLCNRRRLRSHNESCKMKDDEVRQLEMELNKEVVLDPKSKICRFCDKELFNVQTLHRHDKTCKMKQEYKERLLKELNRHQQHATTTNNATVPNITINIDNSQIDNRIDNSHNIHNNTLNQMNIMNYDHDYSHVSIEDILRCLKISKEKREDAIASLGRFIRHTDKDDRSIIITNQRAKMIKVFEDGKYVSKDARRVISHRGQEAACRLDLAKDEVDEEHHPLWKNKDFGDVESTLSMATESNTDKEVNRAFNEVKMAIIDSSN
jgi:hypothetical protein